MCFLTCAFLVLVLLAYESISHKVHVLHVLFHVGPPWLLSFIFPSSIPFHAGILFFFLPFFHFTYFRSLFLSLQALLFYHELTQLLILISRCVPSAIHLARSVTPAMARLSSSAECTPPITA